MEIICGAPARSARPFLDFLSPADIDLDRFLKGFIADFWQQGFRYGLLLFLLTALLKQICCQSAVFASGIKQFFKQSGAGRCVVLNETLVYGNNSTKDLKLNRMKESRVNC